jgi:hypothetical protein
MTPEMLAKQLAADVAAKMKTAVEKIRADFEKTLGEIQTAFENRFAALPAPEKGEPGEKGIDGAPGTVDMDEVKGILLGMVAALELPKGEKGDAGEPGAPGQVDMEAVKQLVLDAVAAIEIPKGEKGETGAAGKDAVFDEVKVWEMVVEEFKKVELPVAEKGDKGDPGEVDMTAVQQLIADEVAKRDTVRVMLSEEEIEDGISERRSYARGTLARHKGGLWRAHERTKGMKGWECIIAGVADIALDYDGERKITISISKSDGEVETKEVYVPAQLYKDVYREGQLYFKNDVVTLSGSQWTAKCDTKGRPGISDDWTCSVKRGGTGKSAYDLARDAGFTGTRQEWLDQIGKKPQVKV